MQSNTTKSESTLLLSLVLIFFLFIFNPLESVAQTGKVSGKLIDSKTQQPVSYVQVALFGNLDNTSPEAYSDTNEDGVFNLTVPKGKYVFKAFFIGYQDLVVSDLLVDGATQFRGAKFYK